LYELLVSYRPQLYTAYHAHNNSRLVTDLSGSLWYGLLLLLLLALVLTLLVLVPLSLGIPLASSATQREGVFSPVKQSRRTTNHSIG
jgi:hypothetical protein